MFLQSFGRHDSQHSDTQHNDTQHNDGVSKLSVVYADCRIFFMLTAVKSTFCQHREHRQVPFTTSPPTLSLLNNLT